MIRGETTVASLWRIGASSDFRSSTISCCPPQQAARHANGQLARTGWVSESQVLVTSIFTMHTHLLSCCLARMSAGERYVSACSPTTSLRGRGPRQHALSTRSTSIIVSSSRVSIPNAHDLRIMAEQLCLRTLTRGNHCRRYNFTIYRRVCTSGLEHNYRESLTIISP